MCAGCAHAGGKNLIFSLETDLFPCKDTLLPINVVCFTVGLCGNLNNVDGDCSIL